MRKLYKITPSSVSDWFPKGKLVRCYRCQWMRMNNGWSASLALPMANRVTKVIEDGVDGKRTEQYVPELGKGEIIETSGIVSSVKLPIDSEHDFFIAGEYDHLAKLEDGTFAVIDDKTSGVFLPEKLTPEKQLRTYQRQLNAYAYCLENPAPQKLLDFYWNGDDEFMPNQPHRKQEHISRVPKKASEAVTVSRMAINSYMVEGGDWDKAPELTLKTHRVYAEVEKDYDGLLEYCEELADLTKMDSPPESHEKCTFCKDFDKNVKFR